MNIIKHIEETEIPTLVGAQLELVELDVTASSTRHIVTAPCFDVTKYKPYSKTSLAIIVKIDN